MEKQLSRIPTNVMKEKPLITPQTNIYNRHFYLRGAEHELRQIQYDKEIKQLANKPKITPSSYHILVEQLENKLIKIFANNCSENGQENFYLDNADLDFLQLQQIVLEACQINEKNAGIEMEHFLSQVWLILGEYSLQSEIKASVAYALLRILLDPYNLDIKECSQMLNSLPEWRNGQTNRIEFLQQYPELEEETLSEIEILKLWRKIRFCNPVFTQLPSKGTENIPKFTYKPSINAKSEELAAKSLQRYLSTHQSQLTRTLGNNKSESFLEDNDLSKYLEGDSSLIENDRNKGSYHNILYQRKLAKDELVPRTLERDDSFSIKASRTARPNEIKEIVNNLYVVKPKRLDTNFTEKDEEEELKQCTFSPKINKSYSSRRRSISPNVKGYEKQVIRLQKGREEKERKKQAYENLGKVKNPIRSTSKSPRASQGFKFLERDNPKLILEINIDGDRVEKLNLRGDENPRLVSKKFVIKHGLEEQMIEVLEALVEEQLRNL